MRAAHIIEQREDIARDGRESKKKIRGRRDTFPWQSGFLKRMPWTSLLALLWALGCVAATGLILYFSNGRPKLEWRYAPNIWLAVLSAVGNALIRYAQADGVNVSWWTRSLRGTSLADLHREWAYGTSIWAVVVGAGTNIFNLVAWANMFTVLCLLDGPLLQRASTIVVRSTVQAVPLNVSVAAAVGNFSSIPGVAGSLSTEFTQVLADYAGGKPIQINVEGCYGTCTGKIHTLGLNGSCEVVHTESRDWAQEAMASSNDTGTFQYIEATLLNVTFPDFFFWSMLEDNRRLLDFEATYFTPDPGPPPMMPYDSVFPSWMPTCPGVLTRKACSYNIGIVEYPVSITNQTLTLASNDSVFPMTSMESFLRSGPGELMSNGYYNLTRAYGFNDAARWLFSSQITISPLVISANEGENATFAWRTNFDGPLAVQNLGVTNISSCNRALDDPTVYILRSLTDILLRVGIATAQSDPWPVQSLAATQLRQELVYASNLRYFAAAACIMLAGIALVAGTFRNWWLLGRAVSLSPVEIAKAFDALLLAVPGAPSNAHVSGLLDVVGPLQVKYGAATVEVSGPATQTIDVDGQSPFRHRRAHVPARKLCIAGLREVESPDVGEELM